MSETWKLYKISLFDKDAAYNEIVREEEVVKMHQELNNKSSRPEDAVDVELEELWARARAMYPDITAGGSMTIKSGKDMLKDAWNQKDWFKTMAIDRLEVMGLALSSFMEGYRESRDAAKDLTIKSDFRLDDAETIVNTIETKMTEFKDSLATVVENAVKENNNISNNENNTDTDTDTTTGTTVVNTANTDSPSTSNNYVNVIDVERSADVEFRTTDNHHPEAEGTNTDTSTNTSTPATKSE